MTLFPPHFFTHLAETYGIWGVFLVVMLESSGLPLPGETALVSAAVYAGATHLLPIEWVVAAAAGGAIVGDNIGFAVGHFFGPGLLERHGDRIGLDADKRALGRYLFKRYGGAIVFFGRFAAVLRAFAALLAGANRYAWDRFLFFNAAGAIVWASLFGFGAYLFGRSIHRLTGPVGIATAVVAVVAGVAAWRYYRHHEAALIAAARADMVAERAGGAGVAPGIVGQEPRP